MANLFSLLVVSRFEEYCWSREIQSPLFWYRIVAAIAWSILSPFTSNGLPKLTIDFGLSILVRVPGPFIEILGSRNVALVFVAGVAD